MAAAARLGAPQRGRRRWTAARNVGRKPSLGNSGLPAANLQSTEASSQARLFRLFPVVPRRGVGTRERGEEWRRWRPSRSKKRTEGFTGGDAKNAAELSGSVEERSKKHTHAHTELRIVGNELVVWWNGRQAGREGGSPGRANCRTPYNRGGHFVASRCAAAPRSCIITPFLCSLG